MPVKYCSLEPEFPKNAFICTVIFNKENKIRGSFFLNQIYVNFKEMQKDIEKISRDLDKKEGWYLEENALISEITFDRIYPLKKEYWENPVMDYAFTSRDSNLETALLKSGFYFLLVTPSAYIDKSKKWCLTAPIAFPISAGDETIEKFMLSSNWPVDKRAQNAAIYRFGSDLLYNWQTRKTIFKNTKKGLRN